METDRNIETFEFLKERWPLKVVIRALIDLNEIDRSKLAKENGISVPSMSATVNFHRNHPGAQAVLSRELGILVRELFANKGNGN